MATRSDRTEGSFFGCCRTNRSKSEKGSRMIPVTTRPGLVCVLILAFPAGVRSAQEPATVAQAAKLINLETFPLLPGGVSKAPRRLANLGYTARGGHARGVCRAKKDVGGTRLDRAARRLPE